MRVSEMIKNLQEFMNEHGDLNCWYAADDEGNRYQEIHYNPSLFYVDTSRTRSYEGYGDLEEAEECDADIEKLNPVCIVN